MPGRRNGLPAPPHLFPRHLFRVRRGAAPPQLPDGVSNGVTSVFEKAFPLKRRGSPSTFAPLPCWQHLSREQYCDKLAELIEAIIAKAAAHRAATGIESLDAAAILRQHPFTQPAKTKRSPAPLVHAATKRVRAEMRIAYLWFVRAFRAAAGYLRAGDRLAPVPRASFPPGLPFLRAGRLAISPAT